jgi:hypothetical protein
MSRRLPSLACMINIISHQEKQISKAFHFVYPALFPHFYIRLCDSARSP